jgi:hypothetical protein
MGDRQRAIGKREKAIGRWAKEEETDSRLAPYGFLLKPLFLQVFGEFPLFFIQAFGVAEENADIFIAFASALQAG